MSSCCGFGALLEAIAFRGEVPHRRTSVSEGIVKRSISSVRWWSRGVARFRSLGAVVLGRRWIEAARV